MEGVEKGVEKETSRGSFSVSKRKKKTIVEGSRNVTSGRTERLSVKVRKRGNR